MRCHSRKIGKSVTDKTNFHCWWQRKLTIFSSTFHLCKSVATISQMRDRESTHPFVFFFLVLPYGISSGFVSITLPFILTRVGFSVALAASIVAIGVSANL